MDYLLEQSIRIYLNSTIFFPFRRFPLYILFDVSKSGMERVQHSLRDVLVIHTEFERVCLGKDKIQGKMTKKTHLQYAWSSMSLPVAKMVLIPNILFLCTLSEVGGSSGNSLLQ